MVVLLCSSRSAVFPCTCIWSVCRRHPAICPQWAIGGALCLLWAFVWQCSHITGSVFISIQITRSARGINVMICMDIALEKTRWWESIPPTMKGKLRSWVWVSCLHASWHCQSTGTQSRSRLLHWVAAFKARPNAYRTDRCRHDSGLTSIGSLTLSSSPPKRCIQVSAMLMILLPHKVVFY